MYSYSFYYIYIHIYIFSYSIYLPIQSVPKRKDAYSELLCNFSPQRDSPQQHARSVRPKSNSSGLEANANIARSMSSLDDPISTNKVSIVNLTIEG